MVCLLQPECNFLRDYFRCKLPVEVVDVEEKIMSMQGTLIFQVRLDNPIDQVYTMEHKALPPPHNS